MACTPVASRSSGCLKQALRHCRQQPFQYRQFATTTEQYPSLATKYPPPAPGFRPSLATKQNRPDDASLKRIPVIPPPRSTTKACPDPVAFVTQQQLQTLDPTGARTRLFSPTNVDRAKVGDILHVRFKNSEPYSGVCLVIRKRNSPIDASILLRNQMMRVGVEMWVKIYSPNVEGIEVVQRKEKRARRNKLYYMRQARHDVGSVDNTVRQYLRQRSGSMSKSSGRGRDANSNKKKNNRR